jgi:hypothetical protein
VQDRVQVRVWDQVRGRVRGRVLALEGTQGAVPEEAQISAEPAEAEQVQDRPVALRQRVGQQAARRRVEGELELREPLAAERPVLAVRRRQTRRLLPFFAPVEVDPVLARAVERGARVAEPLAESEAVAPGRAEADLVPGELAPHILAVVVEPELREDSVARRAALRALAEEQGVALAAACLAVLAVPDRDGVRAVADRQAERLAGRAEAAELGERAARRAGAEEVTQERLGAVLGPASPEDRAAGNQAEPEERGQVQGRI